MLNAAVAPAGSESWANVPELVMMVVFAILEDVGSAMILPPLVNFPKRLSKYSGRERAKDPAL